MSRADWLQPEARKKLIPPQLLLYSEEGLDDGLVAAVEAKLQDVGVSKCFGPVRALSAGLDDREDVYPLAANRMFYKLVLHLVALNRFEYMLHMEVDTTPIRQLWLDAISMLMPPFAEPFWLKGSESLLGCIYWSMARPSPLWAAAALQCVSLRSSVPHNDHYGDR